jgi:thiol-disulfide isomerase/thioredoxin
MISKLLLASTLSVTSLFAYKVGDTIDNNIAATLNISNDKIYVVDFFASWCASCKIELPIISKLN